MASGFVIRKNQYYDSVFLMRISKRISDAESVQQNAVLMGSDTNKGLLSNIGIQDTQIDAALKVLIQFVEHVIDNLRCVSNHSDDQIIGMCGIYLCILDANIGQKTLIRITSHQYCILLNALSV